MEIRMIGVIKSNHFRELLKQNVVMCFKNDKNTFHVASFPERNAWYF